MKISWIAYLLVGGIMAWFANFIHSKTDNPSIMFFFYVGLLFIAIGVFRLISGLILKDKKKSNSPSQIETKFANMMNKDLANVQANNTQRTQKQIIACPSCGTRHYSTSNFCHNCGTKLR